MGRNGLYDQYVNKEKRIAVIGLGYVGLPIALELAKYFRVIGFDINPKRIEMMREGLDPSKELPPEAFTDVDITFTHVVKLFMPPLSAGFHRGRQDAIAI